MSYKPSSPNHRLNTSTGWKVFSEEPDTEAVYGNYRFKWSVEPPPQEAWYPRIRVHLSIDNGQTWVEENSVWSLYSVNRQLIGDYHDNNSDLNRDLIAAREDWRNNRRKQLDRERRAEFNALPPEQRALIKAERSEAWKLRKQKADERRMERTANIMSQVLEFGPDLVRLKEDIEGLLVTMAKGGMDRPLAYYHSRRRWINGAKWYINGYRRDIEAAQKRTASKR